MARKAKPKALRKQRTREHVIADLSVNFVERCVLVCGFTGLRQWLDYGYDMAIETFDENGQIEEGRILLQLKATDNVGTFEQLRDGCFSYPIDRRDFRLWIKEVYPVFFIFYDAARNEAFWQNVQTYFAENPPSKNSKTVQLRIPRQNVLGSRTIEMMRERKNGVIVKISERSG